MLKYSCEHIIRFVKIIENSEKYGSPLSKNISELALDINQEVLAEAEKEVQKIAVKLMAPLVLCIFPVTFIIIFAPIALSSQF